MKSILQICLVLGLLACYVIASPLKFQAKCVPGENCKAPKCRCWDDRERPGGFSASETPMMVLLSMDYAFNEATVPGYKSILQSLINPNGCRAKGTFFVQKLNSKVQTIRELHDEGNEMAINSARGIIPNTKAKWEKSMDDVIGMLEKAGVPKERITGIRAPELFTGGDDQFDAMADKGLRYDASCVTINDPNHLLWPYTTDFTADLPPCTIGKTPRQQHQGLWELPVPTLKIGNRTCPTPSSCLPNINNTNDVFRLFYDSFNEHYYHNKVPFVIDIDARWVTESYRLDGTLQFLEMVETYTDTWVLTMSQALEWMENPMSISDMEASGYDYKPWDCPQSQKVKGYNRRNLRK